MMMIAGTSPDGLIKWKIVKNLTRSQVSKTEASSAPSGFHNRESHGAQSRASFVFKVSMLPDSGERGDLETVTTGIPTVV